MAKLIEKAKVTLRFRNKYVPEQIIEFEFPIEFPSKEEADKFALAILGACEPIKNQGLYEVNVPVVVTKTSTEIPR